MWFLDAIFKNQKNTCTIVEDAVQSSENVSGSEVPSEAGTEEATDKWWLLVFILSILTTVYLILYTLDYSDTNRLRGYDSCGNICGQKNFKDERFFCTGKDQTNTVYMGDTKQCENISEDMSLYILSPKQHANYGFSYILPKLLLASPGPLGVSLLLTILLQYVPLAVLGVLFISWIFLAFLAYHFLVTIYYNPWVAPDATVPLCVISVIWIIILLCLIINKWDRILLAIDLFMESAKAISDVKQVYLFPTLTLPFLIILVSLSSLLHFYMSTAGILEAITPDIPHLVYVPNILMTAAIALNIFVTLWIVQTVLKFQNTVVSAAVSEWYHSRTSVSMNAFYILNQHLGSIVLGSMLTSMWIIPRCILVLLSQYTVAKGLADWFLRHLSAITHSYIITGAEGSSFLDSYRKVRALINMKIVDTVPISTLGSFLMFLNLLLVFWASFFILGSMNLLSGFYGHVGITLYHHFMMCFVCCYSILGPIQTAYHTLFLCVCQEISNENNRYYSMSIKKYRSKSSKYFSKKIRGVRSNVDRNVNGYISSNIREFSRNLELEIFQFRSRFQTI